MIYINCENEIVSIKDDEISDENYGVIKNILKNYNANVNSWIEICIAFYKKNNYKLFLDLIKEGDNFFCNNKEGDTKFNILLLLYNSEKIINVKNLNKENELKIKLENLINHVEKNKKINNAQEQDDNIGGEEKCEYNEKGKDDYLSHYLTKGIYNFNIYLYLINKYDNKFLKKCALSSSIQINPKDTQNNKSSFLTDKLTNEYINPLNYLIDSINIFKYLIQKNNYDFISSIYLSFALCLIYKLDHCIEFSSHVLLKIINFEIFLNKKFEEYRKKPTNFVDQHTQDENENNLTPEKEQKGWFSKFVGNKNTPSPSPNKKTQDIRDTKECLQKCIKLKNLLNLLKVLKSIIKCIIGICYMKKKNFSMASYCFTTSLQLYSFWPSYLLNSWLLLTNYINKVVQNNSFINIKDKLNFLSNYYVTQNNPYNDYVEYLKKLNKNKILKNGCLHFENYVQCEKINENKCRIFFDNKQMDYQKGNVNSKVDENDIILSQVVTIAGNEKGEKCVQKNFNKWREYKLANTVNNLSSVHVKDIINLTLFYYLNYMKGTIIFYSKIDKNIWDCEENYDINKNDIYEYDEIIDPIDNTNKECLKNKYAHIFLNNNMISMYLDLCEFWLAQGNKKAIILLKIIKEKINFSYVNTKQLSRYYLLIGIYFHIIKNMKRALKYYRKSFIINKNYLNLYYYTVSYIYLKKYNKAKKYILYAYSKYKNVYFIKLYAYFYIHTANIYLNYNVIINKQNDTSLRDGNPGLKKGGSTLDEIYQHKPFVDNSHIYNKFIKSDMNNENIKVTVNMLDNILSILNKYDNLFIKDIDITLMKAKIYELLLTKYNDENMKAYFNLLNDIPDIKNFFFKKNKTYKISYELINNYIVALFYCDYKEKSLQLMELLKKEIFFKIKKFYTYYVYVFCKDDLNNPTTENTQKKGTKIDKYWNKIVENEKLRHNSGNNINKNRKISGKGHKENKKNDNISKGSNMTNGMVTCLEKKKIIEENKIKLKYIKEMLKCERVYKVRENLLSNMGFINRTSQSDTRINNTGKINVYEKQSKKERCRNIINYLKKIYITINFNTSVLLEYNGYSYISTSIYKIFTKIYINYESAYIRLANIYIRNKNYAKAKDVIAKGLKYNNNSVQLNLLKVYLHIKRKHYDYSIYSLDKLKKSKQNKINDFSKNENEKEDNLQNENSSADTLINTYLAIIKFYKIKDCKSKSEKTFLLNEIYNLINILTENNKNNFFIANLISVLLSINNNYEVSCESFQCLIDSYNKLSYFYISSLKNLVLHMFNHIIRNNNIINNKLFVNKLNLFFNLTIKNGVSDKKFYLCYSNFLHILDRYEESINLLYEAYQKWPYDISLLNTLIICIDSCVSKYLSSDYVDLKNILFMKDLIYFSFHIIYTLLHFKHFAMHSTLLSSEKKRKQMSLMNKTKRQESLHEELLKDVNDLNYHLSGQVEINKEDEENKLANIEFNNNESNMDKNLMKDVANDKKYYDDVEAESSSSDSSDLFEEKKTKKRKIDTDK
ncbi:tetratricopeptide repeat protein, putative [Plasmodium vinckei brucechwatti]|uniref:Tetratricopeptide repeat protein, putative n=1 Tax=Plasmodium vinckei brucechwatti TaxID=119398 RepID=A0A6V7S3S7_PLAVN|nr:tetratricopeptide repeat protein, putative [Plasmodium vinckei brucechwatti]